MIVLLSPAKTMDFSPGVTGLSQTRPQFQKEAKIIAAILKKMDAPTLGKLLSCSAAIAQETHHRYAQWSAPPKKAKGKEALLAYAGTVFDGMNPATFTPKQFAFAAKHVRILDALYGWVRPTDMVAPYRLEMQTRLPVQNKKNVIDFWREPLGIALARELEPASLIVNLASLEYSKVLGLSKVPAQVVTPVFKDDTGKGLKVLGAYAKRARGLFCRYLVKKQITTLAPLTKFKEEGYAFNKTLSNPSEYVFTRTH